MEALQMTNYIGVQYLANTIKIIKQQQLIQRNYGNKTKKIATIELQIY